MQLFVGLRAPASARLAFGQTCTRSLSLLPTVPGPAPLPSQSVCAMHGDVHLPGQRHRIPRFVVELHDPVQHVVRPLERAHDLPEAGLPAARDAAGHDDVDYDLYGDVHGVRRRRRKSSNRQRPQARRPHPPRRHPRDVPRRVRLLDNGPRGPVPHPPPAARERRRDRRARLPARLLPRPRGEAGDRAPRALRDDTERVGVRGYRADVGLHAGVRGDGRARSECDAGRRDRVVAGVGPVGPEPARARARLCAPPRDFEFRDRGRVVHVWGDAGVLPGARPALRLDDGHRRRFAVHEQRVRVRRHLLLAPLERRVDGHGWIQGVEAQTGHAGAGHDAGRGGVGPARRVGRGVLRALGLHPRLPDRVDRVSDDPRSDQLVDRHRLLHQGCLIAFVGIYPTLIIALVALNKSRADAPQSSGYALPTLGGSFPLSPLRRNSDLSTVGDVRQRASHRAGLDPFAKRMPSDSETFTHLSEETVHWQDDGDETGKESFIP
ncbi:hypothetical protein GSI_11334 [Ganoderma sinense ZZ0214-1]|uniref:Uncharacterized protein n=1 Tax=Ganoderma sinense ZZ0214-1 TaxID=1077348 RepID=A0A2G8RVQ8_9APHY|nr:hypothetical protein GSI_11334 [Ganoderma sinense ZZ0214-1]